MSDNPIDHKPPVGEGGPLSRVDEAFAADHGSTASAASLDPPAEGDGPIDKVKRALHGIDRNVSGKNEKSEDDNVEGKR